MFAGAFECDCMCVCVFVCVFVTSNNKTFRITLDEHNSLKSKAEHVSKYFWQIFAWSFVIRLFVLLFAYTKLHNTQTLHSTFASGSKRARVREQAKVVYHRSQIESAAAAFRWNENAFCNVPNNFLIIFYASEFCLREIASRFDVELAKNTFVSVCYRRFVSVCSTSHFIS